MRDVCNIHDEVSVKYAPVGILPPNCSLYVFLLMLMLLVSGF